MKNFNWSKFKKGNITVHCNTLEKANDFLKECYNMGMTWRDNDSLLYINEWRIYKENTCYSYKDNGIGYDNINYYKKEDYKIIEWEIKDMKFNWSDFKKGKFVVEINDDNRQQFIKEIKEKCKDIGRLNKWNYDSYYYYVNNNIVECVDNNYSCYEYVINFIPNTNNDKYEIYITSDGTTTNCVYKLNDKVVNKSSAKLNPIDKFDFKEGAKICIDRVFEDNKLNEGDIVEIINERKCYSSYNNWLIKNIDDKKVLLNFELNKSPKNFRGRKFKIIKKAPYSNLSKMMLYCIESLSNSDIFLFSKDGLRKVE